MDALTIRHLDTEEEREAALAALMASMGFEIVDVAGEELLLPIDHEHPDYAKCNRAIRRARARASA